MAMTSLAAASMAACSTSGAKAPEAYPTAPCDSTVVDDYFGMTVADVYRPLEDDTAAATLEWVRAENAVTDAYMDAIPFRSQLRKRMAELSNYCATGLPSLEKDGRYYYFENDGTQNQAVLYVKDSLNGEGRVVLDPNKLSDNGTVALAGISFDPRMRYMAYAINRNGSDWAEIYVLDLQSGKLLSDHVEWCKFTEVAWHGDGFYYSAYPAPEAGKEFSNANENHRIHYHRLDTPQSEDRVEYEDTAHPLYFHTALTDDDQNMLMLYMAGDGNGNGMKVKDLRRKDAQWVTMEESQENTISVFDVEGDTLYIETSWGAPRSRIMMTTIDRPQRQYWQEIVPEQEGVLAGAQRVGRNHFIFTYEQDAVNRAFLYTTTGQLVREIELPGPGTVAFSTDDRTDEVRYGYISFLNPSRHYLYDIKSGKSTLLHENAIAGFNPDDYVTEQVFYPSADGTKIPMFITYKKGLKRDGKNPTLLYGYGGFAVSLNPSFNATRLAWLESGGIYASANLRGGSEYGEEWHQAGTKLQKLNVFNDFIAAAQWLIDEGYTSTPKLAIMGGSNGGLLVGAVTNMRPDLFAASVAQVGVMDMMRYHRFTIGWNWASDYGTSADSPEMARYLLDYSPLHNIRNDGTPYPAMLITTADHDDRVVPAHSFKYAATLQAANTGSAPKLIRTDSDAGHGGGKPLEKRLDEAAETYAFLFWNLGFSPAQ